MSYTNIGKYVITDFTAARRNHSLGDSVDALFSLVLGRRASESPGPGTQTPPEPGGNLMEPRDKIPDEIPDEIPDVIPVEGPWDGRSG